MTTYSTKVLEVLDNGDAVIELPEELMEELGWKLGDTIDYEFKDGQIFVRNLTKEAEEKDDASN